MYMCVGFGFLYSCVLFFKETKVWRNTFFQITCKPNVYVLHATNMQYITVQKEQTTLKNTCGADCYVLLKGRGDGGKQQNMSRLKKGDMKAKLLKVFIKNITTN